MKFTSGFIPITYNYSQQITLLFPLTNQKKSIYIYVYNILRERFLELSQQPPERAHLNHRQTPQLDHTHRTL